MKKITIVLFLLMPFLMFSQKRIGKVAEKVQSSKIEQKKFKSHDIFKSGSEEARINYSDEVENGVVLAFDKSGVETIYNENPKQLELNLPLKPNGKPVRLELIQKDIFSPDFKVMTSDGRDITDKMDRGKFYRGMVAGNPQSLVSISIFKNEIMGFISNGDGNYTIGKLKDSDTNHIIYKDTNLRQAEEFVCHTEDNGKGYTKQQLDNTKSRGVGDCVNVYVEAGQSVYNSFGGDLTLTTNFLNGVFGQSYVLYANEGITMQTSSMLIWTTPDPYNGGSTGAQLGAFQAQTGAFQGDIGHLVEVQNIGGLAAGFNGICNPNTDQSLCFSGFSGNSFSNVPVVSFNVFILTHEMGHLLGSRHTHACVWNGDNTAIDTCSGFTEGPCPLVGSPAGGGTIMSYCINTVGLDFTQGFGPQPGNVIRNTVNNPNNCLVSCSGPNAVCKDITVQLDANGNANITGADVDGGSSDPQGPVTLSVSPNTFTCANLGANIVTLTVMNASGATATCTATVTVEDNIKPVAPTPPVDVDVQCAADVPPPVDLTAVDNCDGNITVSPSAVITPGNCENQFKMVRTWTFTDGSGNSSSISQTINVNDDTPPTINCPTEVINLPGCNPIRPTVDDAVSSVVVDDNCGIKSVIANPGPVIGDCYKTQIFNVVVTDLCGNTANCDVTYTWFEDFEAPVVTAQHERTFEMGCNPNVDGFPAGQSFIDNGFITVTDNCNATLPEIVLDRTEQINIGCKNFLIYYYKATDDCGNTTPLRKMAKVTYQWEEDDEPTCEVAFARYKGTDMCFADDNDSNSNQTGWTNYFDAPGEYTMQLYAGVSDCDVINSENVGKVMVDYTGSFITLNFIMYENYVMGEAYVNIGCEKYPLDNSGQMTTDSDHFNYRMPDLEHVRNYTVGPIDISQTNGVYVIAEAVTCLQKCDCSVSPYEGGSYLLTAEKAIVECRVADGEESLSINDSINSPTFKAYPVPFENDVVLEYKFNYETDVTIEVFDLKGALIKRVVNNAYNAGTTTKTKMDFSNLSDQLYFVKLKTNKGVGVKKLVSN